MSLLKEKRMLPHIIMYAWKKSTKQYFSKIISLNNSDKCKCNSSQNILYLGYVIQPTKISSATG